MSCCGNKKSFYQPPRKPMGIPVQENYCVDCGAPSNYTSEGNYYQNQSWLAPIPRTEYDKMFMAKYNPMAENANYNLLNIWEPFSQKKK